MKAPTNISTLPFEAPKRSMAQNLIYATCAVAVLFVIALFIAENVSQRLDAVYTSGMKQGYSLAQSDAAKKQVTDATCLSWWFSDDPKRVGKAIKQIKLEASK